MVEQVERSRRFAGAVTTITALNALGALLSAANIGIIAWLYGVSRPVEIYLFATQIYTLIISLSQSGKIGELFLPAYHELKHSHGGFAAFGGFSAMCNWMGIVTLTLSLFSSMLANPILALAAPGFTAEEQALGAQMLQAIAPMIFLQVLMAMGQTLLYAEQRFGGPELISVISKLATPIALIVTYDVAGIWAAVIGLWAATLIQAFGTAVMVGGLGYQHRWILRSEGLNQHRLLVQVLQTFWYVAATQFFLFTMSASLSLLPHGVYAVFRYAEQFHSKTYTLLMRPISLVFFTAFSSASAAGSAEQRPMIRHALNQGLALITLAVAGFAVAGVPLLSALLGSKELGETNLIAVAQMVLFLYALQYLMLLEQISRKVAITLGRINPLFWTYAGCQVLSAVAAWLIIPSQGLIGAAIVLGLNVLLLTLAAYAVTAQRDHNLVMIYSPRACAQWLVAGGAGVLGGMAVTPLASIGPLATHGRIESGLVGISMAAATIAITFTTAIVLRNPEAIAYRSAVARLFRLSK